jgi:dienelactone hydrolase
VALNTRFAFLALALLGFVGACGGGVKDPESARCADPRPTFGTAVDLGDHREADVHFTCEGAVLAGTLYLPSGTGPFPAVVWVHGSGEQTRVPYAAAVVGPLVQEGVAVLSYDKRGAGDSEGVCCPGDHSHYNLLAADADGAVVALRLRSDVDRARVGFYGPSEAGWVVPLADSRLTDPVAFTALVSAPAVTTGEEAAWSEAAGEDEPGPLTQEKRAEATRKVEDAGPSGFDPLPYIKKMQTPGLWLYGGGDKSIPTDRCVAILEDLKAQGKNFTITVFPGAGHGLVDTVPTAREAPVSLVSWIEKTVKTG